MLTQPNIAHIILSEQKEELISGYSDWEGWTLRDLE